MTDEGPEFHTRAVTPLSPLPVHPPEPSNIPVLCNQIDPVFNMTSTHIAPPPETQPTLVMETAPDTIDADGIVAEEGSDASDPFAEDQDKPEDDDTANIPAEATDDANDDYAMTFDSDGEGEIVDDVEKEVTPPVFENSKSQSTSIPIATATESSIVSVPAATTHGPSQASASPSTLASTSASVGEAELITRAQNGTKENFNSSAAPVPALPQIQAQGSGSIGDKEIDIQQLLDNITANANNAPAGNAISPTTPTHTFPAPGLSAHSSLPPRPPTQQKPSAQPAYPGAPGVSAAPPGYPSYGAPGVHLVAAGAPGTSTDHRNVLPPPPSASFGSPPGLGSNPSAPFAQASRAQPPPPGRPVRSDLLDDADTPWGPDIQKLYDTFLTEERGYVTEGLWDRFPVGSRLFIGNLPTEKVTKRDLFHVFHKYGRLAQVSIKQAYGFVQFHDVDACHFALENEQGAELRGRRMHLEISKPQKNTKNASNSTATTGNRRSRSPDYARGGAVDRGGRSAQRGGSTTYDRYDNRQGSARVSDFRSQGGRQRDDYRPGRSPSPTRGNFRGGRDDYSGRGGRDYYDGRERRRSRSRSPYGRRDGDRYRHRSPSPRVRESIEDADLQIPRRDPRDVPDVQIILMDELDRGFINWVEGELRNRGIKLETMFLSTRLSLQAVINRQILEGVLAVTQLTRQSQDKSKIPLQVFDRSAGAGNVRFDEYQDLEPRIVAELVVREKDKAATVSTPSSSTYPQFPTTQGYQPAPAAQVPNLASLVGNLDNATLQQLLGNLNAVPLQQNSQLPPVQNNTSTDIASILGSILQQPAQQPNYPPPQQNPYGSSGASNGTNSMHASTSAQAQGNSQQSEQVQNIMAQLARYRQ